jgi:spore coat protein U-like protein
MSRFIQFLFASLALMALAGAVLPQESHAARAAPAKPAIALGCNVAISTVAFGSIDVLPGTAISTNATLSISCGLFLLQDSILVCILLPARSMPGTPALAWDLFGPPPSTTSWSNTAQLLVSAAALSGGTATFTIPATIRAGQSAVPPGAYSQTLSATATWGTTNCTSGGVLASGSSTFSFQATATVVKSCNVSAGNLDFGSVGDLNTVVNAQSVLSVLCTKNTGYTIGLGGGLSGATDPTARLMKAGSDSIRYGLYQPPAGTTPWGSSVASSVAGTGNATTQSIAVFGRVPVQTTPPAGTYSDTIVATVTY